MPPYFRCKRFVRRLGRFAGYFERSQRIVIHQMRMCQFAQVKSLVVGYPHFARDRNGFFVMLYCLFNIPFCQGEVSMRIGQPCLQDRVFMFKAGRG